MEQKRLDYLDSAKAIALLFVIYGHTFRDSMRAASAWCDLSYIFVYRFHVSLLFLISGMGYALSASRHSTSSPAQYLQKKAHSLLLPWFSYSVLIYLLFALVQLIPAFRSFLSSSSYRLISPFAYAIALLRNENPYSFHLWYLQTLFLFIAVTYLIDHFLSQKSARRIKIVLILLLPAFYMFFCQSWIWTFKGFFQKYFFFLLGTLLSPQIVERHARFIALSGVLSLLYLLAELFYPPADVLYENVFTSLPLTYLDNLAIIGFCLGILAFCILFREKLQWAAAFGQDTMLYYLYHQPFCCAVFSMILYDKLHIPALATVLLCMIASLLIPYLFRSIVRRLGLVNILETIGLPA